LNSTQQASPRIMSSVRVARAAWSMMLVTLMVSGEVEKEPCSPETCSPSLLQIGSSIHEAHQQSQGSLLLQVGARTGEVSQFVAHHDEDAASSATMTQERRHDIENLLSHDEGAGFKLTKKPDKDEKETENAAEEVDDQKGVAKSAHEKGSSAKETESSNSEETKPDAQVLQGARIAPFGKEDTARELQHHAARTQDTLVDAIENAEVAEIKRSIFRSLTRLRAAEIKEFDTIARLETQAIDEYNDNHHYRAENPLDYIHSAETTVKEDKYTSFHD